MVYLLVVSLVWAVSFGLIRANLTNLDPDVGNAFRLVLAAALFAPFLSLHRMPRKIVVACLGIGAIQFACMYFLYTRSYQQLQAHQVALATIMTPLYVTLLADLLDRRLRWRFLLCALLAVVGTALSLGAGSTAGIPVFGLVLVQGANLCFTIGQVWYRRTVAGHPDLPDSCAFAWCALGAAALAVLLALPALVRHGFPTLTLAQMGTLAYLGVIASGLCFFLWNRGARRVSSGVLAVLNDLKIPLGVLASLVVFGERAEAWRLAAGGTVRRTTSLG